MICSEVGEFISALCDGETVPPAAAEHIGGCVMCGARLHEYLALGAEMRRVASLERVEDIPVRSWGKERRTAQSWWTKGWETMRIPRFAFALLLIAIVALGSGLIVTRAKAHTEGSVLMLTITNTPESETPLRCALSLVDKKLDRCAFLSPPQNMLGIRILSHSADQIELGIREQYTPTPAKAGSYTASINDLEKVPEVSYWFRPGEKLEIPIPGARPLNLTGELSDHIPPFVALNHDVEVDPKARELRITSPLLLRGDKVLFDFEGGSSIQKGSSVVQMYMPGQGLWALSLRPLEGGVQAEVNMSRIKFDLEGEKYTFLTALPVTREQHIWVLHDPKYKPAAPNPDVGFIGATERYLLNGTDMGAREK